MPAAGQDGDDYVRALARFVRQHERAFADVLLPANRRVTSGGPMSWMLGGSAAAQAPPPVLPLDPHHLAYLLLRFEEAGVPTSSLGSVDTTLDEAPSRPMSYLSLLDHRAASDDRAETRSMLSTVTSLGSRWWGGTAEPVSVPADARYLYSCFTRLPALKLAPTAPSPSDRFVTGFETLPDGRYVPLYAFKNLSVLALRDLDPRAFLGWDQLADCLRSLEITASGLEDISDLFIDRVRDDERRRRGEQRRANATPRRRRERDGSSAAQTASEAEADDAAPLSASKWAQLRQLSLAGNYLTFLPVEPLQQFSRLVHLDLSGNLLVAIPSGLSALVSLRSLNLADNMIDSVLAIYKVLGAVQTVVLSRNRLESLCGLERLFALERIDLRENRIEDVGEVGRLASLPSLRELWVDGNPFVAHPANQRTPWRIACFNAFANAGRERDAVKLDGALPTYGERRQIVDVRRAPIGSGGDSSGVDEADERLRARMGRQMAIARSPSPPPPIPRPPANGDRPISPPTSPLKSAPASPTAHHRAVKAKRRKPARIVDLNAGSAAPSTAVGGGDSEAGMSDGETLPPAGPGQAQHSRAASHGSPSHSRATQQQRALGHGRAATEASRSSPQRTKVSAATFEAPPPQLGDDAFRKRIEALRAEGGVHWLAALGDSDLSGSDAPIPTTSSSAEARPAAGRKLGPA